MQKIYYFCSVIWIFYEKIHLYQRFNTRNVVFFRM